MTVNLIFSVEVECDEENADGLGKELAVFLKSLGLMVKMWLM